MDRRFLAIGVVVIIAIAGVSVILVINLASPKPSTSFHDEQKVSAIPDYDKLVKLTMSGLSNCSLSIGFVNDTSLLYRLDVRLCTAAVMSSAFTISIQPSSPTDPPEAEVNFTAHVPMQSVSVVLGTNKTYQLYIEGTNLTTSVVYGNGALMGVPFSSLVPTEFRYHATGTLSFQFLDSVKVGRAGLQVILENMLGINKAKITVELPSALSGRLVMTSCSVTQVALAGRWADYSYWYYVIYATSYTWPEPSLGIYIDSWTVTAYLG